MIDAIVNQLDALREQQQMSKAELARAIDKNPAAIRRLLTASGNPQPKDRRRDRAGPRERSRDRSQVARSTDETTGGSAAEARLGGSTDAQSRIAPGFGIRSPIYSRQRDVLIRCVTC